MARGNRRSKGRVNRGVRPDWVYTNQGYSIDPVLLEYGSVGALAVPLTISQNARREIAFGSPGIEPVWADYNQIQSGAAFPEGANLRVHAVDGVIMCQPNDWALATFFRLGLRLIHGEMTNFTGELSIEAGYSMWEGTTPETINQWANSGFLKEWYKAERWEGSISGLVTRVLFTYPIRWKSRSPQGLRIGNSRALFLWMESDFNSRALTIWTRLRCLVSAGTSG